MFIFKIVPTLVAALTLAVVEAPALGKSARGAGLATQSDYGRSLQAFAKEDFKAAGAQLPPQEHSGFIETIERGWLNVLIGKGNSTPLLKLREEVEKREILRVSAESKRFFYKETEEGYVPGEHEIVALHLVTGMAFAQQGECPKAMIEARKAIFYLDNTQQANARDFDDPMIRYWLGALWTACGDWGEARVSFRKAFNLDATLTVAKELADLAKPPDHIALVLALPATDIVKTAEVDGQVVSFNSLWFEAEERPLDLVWASDGAKPAPFSRGPDAAKMYDNHLRRNHAIRDFLDRTRYNVNALGAQTKAAGTEALGGFAYAATVGVGIVSGAAVTAGLFQLMYPAAVTINDLIGSVILPPLVGFVVGKSVADGAESALTASQNEAKEVRDSVAPSRRYRFVRFLPWRAVIQYRVKDDKTRAAKIQLAGKTKTPFLSVLHPDNGPRVDFFEVMTQEPETDQQRRKTMASARSVNRNPSGRGYRTYLTVEGNASPREDRTIRESARLPHYAGGGWFSSTPSNGFGNPQDGFGFLRHSPRTEDRSMETSLLYNAFYGGHVLGWALEAGGRIHDVGPQYAIEGGLGFYLYPFRVMARGIGFLSQPKLSGAELSVGLLVKVI